MHREHKNSVSFGTVYTEGCSFSACQEVHCPSWSPDTQDRCCAGPWHGFSLNFFHYCPPIYIQVSQVDLHSEFLNKHVNSLSPNAFCDCLSTHIPLPDHSYSYRITNFAFLWVILFTFSPQGSNVPHSNLFSDTTHSYQRVFFLYHETK